MYCYRYKLIICHVIKQVGWSKVKSNKYVCSIRRIEQRFSCYPPLKLKLVMFYGYTQNISLEFNFNKIELNAFNLTRFFLQTNWISFRFYFNIRRVINLGRIRIQRYHTDLCKSTRNVLIDIFKVILKAFRYILAMNSSGI